MKILKFLSAVFLICLLVTLPAFAVLNTNSLGLTRASSQSLSITDAAQTGLDLSTALTIMLWVKPTSTPAGGTAWSMVTKHGSCPGGCAYRFAYQGGTPPDLYLMVGNGTGQDDILLDTDLGTGAWKHVAVTWVGASKTFQFFVNGVQTSTDITGTTVASIQNTTEIFSLGFAGANGAYFDGLFDEVRVYDRALSAAEISAMYNRTLTAAEIASTSLKGYWIFDGSSLLDSTGNNNDLTNNNSAAFPTDVPFTGTSDEVLKKSGIINFE